MCISDWPAQQKYGLKHCFSVLPIIMYAAVALAADPVPQDFVSGVDIAPANANAVQSIALPESYYRGSMRRGGGDLRVYNQAGQIVPHQIEQPVDRREYQLRQPLAFFPVYGVSRNDLDSLSLQIERSADGSLINIESDSGVTVTDQQVIAYVIDAGRFNESEEQSRLTRLVFEWSEPQYGFINGLQIAVSNDLESWSTVTSNQSLSRLDYAGQTLGKSHIDLSVSADMDYLRMSWPSEQPPLQITAVTGHYEWSELRDAMPPHSLLLSVTEITDSDDELENSSYRLDTGGRFPLELLSFVGAQQNQNEYYAGRLYSRAAENTSWVDRGRFEQFRLNTEAGVVSSDGHAMGGVRDREWLVRFEYPQQFPAGGAPVVRLSWRPEQLLFLAQGQPPFTLAYGNPEVFPVSADQTSWLENLPEGVRTPDAVAGATLGDEYTLGGQSAVSSSGPGIPWNKVLLWGVLIIGVLLMLWMAIRLYRQMEQAGDSTD